MFSRQLHVLGNGTQEITLTFKITQYGNNSFIGEIVNTNMTKSQSQTEYDNEGAVYYVLAVIFMYGCSILLMIGSFIKKTKHDNHITTYMKDMEKVRRLELTQEKFRTKLQMHQKKVIIFCHPFK